MKSFFQLCGRATRTLGSWIFSFVLWTFWLALAALLVVQIYIATARELEVPGFVLRRIEAKLAESGLRATFDRTSFDPTGRVLMQNVKLFLPSFAEPIVTVRSAYVRVNPLMLIVGRAEPREILLENATATVPAMLSPTGKPEPLLQNLHLSLEPANRSLAIRQCNATIAGVTVNARGTLPLPRERQKSSPDAVSEFFAKKFAPLCREAVTWSEQLTALGEPAVELEFAPSESGAIAIGIAVQVREVELQQPVALRAREIRATTRLLLFGDAPSTDAEITVGELQLPEKIAVRGLRAQVFGRVRLDQPGFDFREVTATVEHVEAEGTDTTGISAQLFPRPLPRVDGRIVAHVLGEAVVLNAETDYTARTAHVNLRGRLSPDALTLIHARTGADVKKYFDYDTFTAERADVFFDAGWKFAKLTADVRMPVVRAYGIGMSDAFAKVELAGDRVFVPDVFARVGQNFARGSYEHDLKTHEFRFLLDGRLRPLDISPWFHDWWPNFFHQFDFTAAAPVANVDVQSAWREGGKARVFIFVDVDKPIIRETPLDHVRTRLFVRPAYYDALETVITRGEGLARGRATYIADPATNDWQSVDLGIDSSLDLKTTEKLLTPIADKVLQPFTLEKSPQIKATGTFSGEAAPHGAHDKLHLEARSSGGFRFYQFPLHDVSFTISLDDDNLVVDQVKALLAGGSASGRARVSGAGEQRRLGFDFALRDAQLGQVAGAVEEFFASQEKRPPAPPGKFIQQKANVRLTLAASAEGDYDNAMSYHGGGNVTLEGAEIGEVPLLGSLSELLKFTALKFNEAQASFKVEGSTLLLPEVKLRGANSAIDAYGEYFIDRHELEISAKLRPLQESDGLIKSVVGAVLSPISHAFEVKLSGTLEKPHWALALSSANPLKALTTNETEKSRSPETDGHSPDGSAASAPVQPTAAKP